MLWREREPEIGLRLKWAGISWSSCYHASKVYFSIGLLPSSSLINISLPGKIDFKQVFSQPRSTEYIYIVEFLLSPYFKE